MQKPDKIRGFVQRCNAGRIPQHPDSHVRARFSVINSEWNAEASDLIPFFLNRAFCADLGRE